MPDRFDIVVVGTGVAGSAAARAAIEEDEAADVLVVERAPVDERGGNSRYTDAYMRLQENGEPAAGFVEDWVAFSEGKIDRARVETIADNAKPAVDWCRAHGVEFELSIPFFLTSNRPRLATLGGGRAILDALLDAAEADGVEVRYETTAEDIALDQSGNLDGLVVRSDEGRTSIETDNIVLAAGGFQGNEKMLSTYIDGNVWDLEPVAPGGRYNKGEGIEMADRLGAQPRGQYDEFHQEPVDPRSDVPEAVIFALPYGVLVNSDGQRFIDEGADTVDEHYETVCRAIRDQPGEIAYFLFDQQFYDIDDVEQSIMSDQDPFIGEPDYTTGNPLQTGLADLCTEIEVDESRLHRTIANYNDAVSEGQFDPTTKDGKSADAAVPKSNWARPLDTPPFYAYPVVAANVFTFGGLAINERSQVLAEDDRVIPGLYAAGETAGFYYGKYPGGTSVIRGLVTGRIAGTHAAGNFPPQSP